VSKSFKVLQMKREGQELSNDTSISSWGDFGGELWWAEDGGGLVA